MPGLGLEWAIQSAQDGARCVSLIGRDKARLQAASERVRSAAPEAIVSAYSADVSDEEGISQAIAEAEAVGGTIDVLIANAGTLEVRHLTLSIHCSVISAVLHESWARRPGRFRSTIAKDGK